MNRKKKKTPPFLFELVALLVSLLLLYSCQDEASPLPERKKETLQNILKDAFQRTGSYSYDLITEVNLNGDLYYEVWSGICYPPFPIYYTRKGEFFCSDHYLNEEEFKCNAEFRNLDSSEREVVYRDQDNCFDAPPINKYSIEPEDSCKGTGAYESAYK